MVCKECIDEKRKELPRTVCTVLLLAEIIIAMDTYPIDKTELLRLCVMTMIET